MAIAVLSPGTVFDPPDSGVLKRLDCQLSLSFGIVELNCGVAECEEWKPYRPSLTWSSSSMRHESLMIVKRYKWSQSEKVIAESLSSKNFERKSWNNWIFNLKRCSLKQSKEPLTFQTGLRSFLPLNWLDREFCAILAVSYSRTPGSADNDCQLNKPSCTGRH